MPADERHKRRGTSKRSRSQSSRSYGDHLSHEFKVPSEPRQSDHPATVEDLRKARLSYLETPREQRQRNMIYEYVKTGPAKGKNSDDVKSVRPASTVSRSRSSTQTGQSTRTKRHRSTRKIETHEEDDEQYVYRTAQIVEEPVVASSSRRVEIEQSPDKSTRASRGSRATRSTVDRRNTEPVTVQERARSEVGAQTSVRPQLRKSTTTIPDALGGSNRRISTISKSEATTTAPTKKSASVLGSFFATKPPAPERKVACLTCGDEALISRTAKLPCTHRMCHACLKRIFKLSVTDPAHMPPRCCTDQAISLKHVDSLFDAEFKKNYNKKLKEYSAKNRVYCPTKGCGEWIQPKHMAMDKGRKIGKCPGCKTLVCGTCNQKMHKTKDCPKDPATKEFTEAAKKAGWQRCFNCSAMVELKEGCNHMTCRCTAEFCMVCGLKWKSCDCAWFSHDQIDTMGDPVRYQQERDRRREQELQDEDIARRLEALQVNGEPIDVDQWLETPNRARAWDDDFIQHAREALTANYRAANDAARGLMNDYYMGPDVEVQDMPGAFPITPPQPRRHHMRRQRDFLDPAAADQEPAPAPAVPPQPEVAGPDGVRVVRHRTHRRRTSAQGDPGRRRALTAAEREAQRRIEEWATGPR